MEGFITFLLFFVLFMWLMKRLFPLLFAWFIKRRIEKGTFGGSNFGGFYSGNMWRNEDKKEEGKVIISDMPKKDKVIDKEIGEYVDFEE